MFGEVDTSIQAQAMGFIRSLLMQNHYLDAPFKTLEIINIDKVSGSTFAVDLNDGTTIRIDIDRYVR